MIGLSVGEKITFRQERTCLLAIWNYGIVSMAAGAHVDIIGILVCELVTEKFEGNFTLYDILFARF